MTLLSVVDDSFKPYVFFGGFILWATFFLSCYKYLCSYKCPKCGHNFISPNNLKSGSIFGSTCSNCGATINETRIPNQQVDPIVKTPADKVEAQGTQGHP